MKRYVPWLIAGFITLLEIIHEFYTLADASAVRAYISSGLFVLAIASFAFMGALIIDRKGGNRMGWLMMVTAIAGAGPSLILVNLYPFQPTVLTLGLWLVLWVNNWFWILLILSTFLILLHFPDGRPPSPRWRWINAVALGTLFLAALLPALSDQIGPVNEPWNLDNPLGIFPTSVIEYGALTWAMGLLIIAVGSLASLFYRFSGEIISNENR
jgi:hypothetical protein